MTAGNNQASSLTTWHGPTDLKLISSDTVKTTIIKFTLQDGSVDLQPASFGLTAARTNGITLRASFDDKIIKLA